MQTLAGIANQLNESLLNIQVNVFEVYGPFERLVLDLLKYLCHAALNGGAVVLGDHTDCSQHCSVGQGALDIEASHALVEVDGCRVTLDQVGDGLRKARRPSLRLVGELILCGRGGMVRHSGGDYKVEGFLYGILASFSRARRCSNEGRAVVLFESTGWLRFPCNKKFHLQRLSALTGALYSM